METESLNHKGLLQQQGEVGGLIALVSRSSMVSHAFSIILVIALALVCIVFMLRPIPILTVDESGNVVGHLEWRETVSRDDDQVVASSKRFLQAYLSLNGATIFEDGALALNHMCDGLREDTLSMWRDTKYLAKIENSNQISRLVFDSERSKLVSRDDGRVIVSLAGDLLLGLTKPDPKPFDTVMTFTLMPRTMNNSLGIEVCKIEDQ